MKLICVMNVYNEAENIARAIESVHEWVDEIHVFDGAYKQFPGKKPYSTDDTKKIATSYPKVVFHSVNKMWKDQMEKRSAMFIGKPGDYYFKLDGDEYVANPQQLFAEQPTHDVYWCWTISPLYSRPYMTARIFKHIPGMHYAGRHHWLFDGEDRLITSDQRMNPKYSHRDTAVRVYNLRNERSQERKDQKQAFIRERNQTEQTYADETKVYKTGFRLVQHPNGAPAPRKPSTVLKEPNQPAYSLTAMFSRPWAVRKYFEHFDKVWLPENTEFVAVIDTNLHNVRLAVLAQLKQRANRFNGITVYFTGHRPPQEFADVRQRRSRIVENWHIILTELRGTTVLGSEDDSLPDHDAYQKMLPIIEGGQADFVQANIIGRWRANICPAWKVVEDTNGQPIQVYTLPEKPDGTEQIEGCGWYCFVAKATTMRAVPMLLDNVTPLGPDLRFGYSLHKAGYKLLHHWGIKVEHFGEKFSLLPGRDATETRRWRKVNDTWLHQH